MLICHSPDICIPRNDYFSEYAISSAAAPPISSDKCKIMTYSNKSGDDSEIYELETDSEPDINDNNSSEIGSSSKSLLSVLKDKKTTSLPKKRKKCKLIAEAWQYFKIEGNFVVCQVELTQDGKKKCEQKYDYTNSNSTTSMNYHIIQEHDIVLKTLDMDEEIDSEEEDDKDRKIDEFTINVLNSSYSSWTRLLELKDAITWLASVLPLKKRKENKKDDQKLSQLLLKDYE
ncbi:22295_t:CDS:2 [Cetraspora pellucida]|uniref:22295_t:CDS:1 n=1 Tax=Cetraspora pellucida TaxID=1433469 RepID=A0A9N9EKY9_9GLOM|nr:22295_t:CDS:2 [Cetraspora pellucida]